MLEKILRETFHIQVEESVRMGMYEAYRNQNQLYMLIPIGNTEEEDLAELKQLAAHQVNYGDLSTCQFLQTEQGEWIVDRKSEGRYCVITTQLRKNELKKTGRKLAKFHYRGRQIPFQASRTGRIGQWKNLWEQRLDQMEKVWSGMLFKQPDHEFERLFLESFPYYMGMAENAIQYLVDTEIDDNPQPVDSGTICHVRFTNDSWGDAYVIKNPFDWVFDHASRDMAEWTRDRYFSNIKLYEPEVRKFFKEYQTVSPLSSFSWRLLYARLVFPLHFFDLVERYYITQSEQDRNHLNDQLTKCLEQTREHEQFLASFFQLAEVPVRRMNIPTLDWLYSIKK